MQGKAHENMYRYTTVCVDASETHVQEGRLYNPFWEGEVAYKGLMQFFLYMEHMLDDMNFPQPFNASRSFATSEQKVEPVCKSHEEQRGRLATFVVKILFRQNASWQGSVLWVEEGREESFRSALELAVLMDSAVEEKEIERRMNQS